MCNYCSGKENIDSNWLRLTIHGNEFQIDYNAYSSDSSFDESLPINFCPMCGKKLECEWGVFNENGLIKSFKVKSEAREYEDKMNEQTETFDYYTELIQ